MLTNDQMIANRFARLARGKKLTIRMNAAWDRGGFVRIGTATHYTDFKVKHRDRIRMVSNGAILTQQGKRWVSAEFCSFQFSA